MDKERIKELENKISVINQNLEKLKKEKEEIDLEIINLKIKPFQIGQEVLAKIPSKKTSTFKKSVLEYKPNYFNSVIVRPYKADGTLSLNYFYIDIRDFKDKVKYLD